MLKVSIRDRLGTKMKISIQKQKVKSDGTQAIRVLYDYGAVAQLCDSVYLRFNSKYA